MFKTVLIALTALLVLVGCDRSAAPTSKANVTIALNWKPEPQFGGFYAMNKSEAFDLTVQLGGSGTPTIQMVASGTVPFAIVSADELLVSRAGGSDVVAVFAVYQTNPQGLLVHTSRKFETIEDIFKKPGKLAVQDGLPYVRYLKQKYGLTNQTVVPNTAGLAVFARDEQMAMQCFVTSEPLTASTMGIPAEAFLIADAGYNPYTTVLVTTKHLADANPALVADVVAEVRAGWERYLADPTATNATMAALNPAMDAETFKASADAQKPLIETAETKSRGLGCMKAERWEQLAQQLVSIGEIPDAKAAEGCYVIAGKKR